MSIYTQVQGTTAKENFTLINVAVIGAGALGTRHLQAIAQMDREVGIWVVDVSEISLENAKKLYEQVPHESVRSINFVTEISAIHDELDAVVVATSSEPRARVVEEILTTKKVKYMVLEKFLFPRVGDYGHIEKLIHEYDCKVWVNCVYRMWPSYQKLRDLLKNEPRLYYIMNGSNWGLACNAIHNIDLIAFLTGSSEEFEFDTSFLDLGHTNSKRDNYIEFTGTLVGKSQKCPFFCITSSKDGNVLPFSEIVGDQIRCVVSEPWQKATIYRAENNWEPIEMVFETPYQSQLTGKLISEIMDTENCSLPTYDESIKLHLPLLKAFMAHLKKETGKDVNICPIT